MSEAIRYFLDTEFIEDGVTIDLISIGVVCEDGREYYREVRDVDWSKANPWVIENVKPHLQGGDMAKPPWVIKAELFDFCDDDGRAGHPLGRRPVPEFWGYYADYDWVVVAQLFGTMMDLPSGWPMFCMDLKQLAVSLGDPELPAQTSTEHHALADARWNAEVHRTLTGGRGAE